MKSVNEKLEILSKKSEQIVLYKNFEIKDLMKGVGKVPGIFDKDLLEFLKFTNGASIFDYCFLGFKNSKLGTGIDKLIPDLWESNPMLSSRFIPFMITSTSDVFGYLNNFSDGSRGHLIAYYNENYEDRLYVIGSSFEHFMSTFLIDVEKTLESSSEKFIYGIDDDDWPINIEHWMKNDLDLSQLHEDGTLATFFKEKMPRTSWS